jgi:hypothetical protein
MTSVWLILGVISIILLIKYWGKFGPNAIWGGFTIGIIIGFIVAIILLFSGAGFVWHVMGRWAIVGTLLGFGAEMIGKISDYFKKTNK